MAMIRLRALLLGAASLALATSEPVAEPEPSSKGPAPIVLDPAPQPLLVPTRKPLQGPKAPPLPPVPAPVVVLGRPPGGGAAPPLVGPAFPPLAPPAPPQLPTLRRFRRPAAPSVPSLVQQRQAAWDARPRTVSLQWSQRRGQRTAPRPAQRLPQWAPPRQPPASWGVATFGQAHAFPSAQSNAWSPQRAGFRPGPAARRQSQPTVAKPISLQEYQRTFASAKPSRVAAPIDARPYQETWSQLNSIVGSNKVTLSRSPNSAPSFSFPSAPLPGTQSGFYRQRPFASQPRRAQPRFGPAPRAAKPRPSPYQPQPAPTRFSPQGFAINRRAPVQRLPSSAKSPVPSPWQPSPRLPSLPAVPAAAPFSGAFPGASQPAQPKAPVPSLPKFDGKDCGYAPFPPCFLVRGQSGAGNGQMPPAPRLGGSANGFRLNPLLHQGEETTPGDVVTEPLPSDAYDYAGDDDEASDGLTPLLSAPAGRVEAQLGGGNLFRQALHYYTREAKKTN